MSSAANFAVLLIYLAAAVAMVPLAVRLGLGSVLGYLLAGVLIGPYALAMVGDATHIMHITEIGVVMMLFLIGLELKPARLWKLRRSIFGLGGLQIVTTALLFVLVLMLALDADWRLALAVGLTLALSSTAIVLQTLTEKKLLRTDTGQNIFSVLLSQDLSLIPIMALLPLLALHPTSGEAGQHGLTSLPGWQQGGIILLTMISMFMIGHWLINPLLRYMANTRLREMFTATALLIVFSITAWMQFIGLSPALGAFVAGVILAESEFRHELVSDIEPFKGLLLGMFFIAVGANIDLSAIIESPGIITLAVVGLITIKLLVLIAVAWVARMRWRQGLLFTLALAQGSEFAFVLASFGEHSGVFDSAQANFLVVVVALSMLISPLGFLLYELYLRHASPLAYVAEDLTPPQPGREVIIAGYGRFGQIVGRLLRAQGYSITILDHSPAQIEQLRRYGHGDVHYGDAGRLELLHQAGAAEAALLIVAVDDPDKTLDIVALANRHFTELKVIVRAFDRRHYYALRQYQTAGIIRETVDGAFAMAGLVLEHLGKSPEEAARIQKLFRQHDELTLERLSEVWGDDVRYGLAVRQSGDELAQVLAEDQRQNSSPPPQQEDKPSGGATT